MTSVGTDSANQVSVMHAKSILLVFKVLCSSSVFLNKLFTFTIKKFGNLFEEASQSEVLTVLVRQLQIMSEYSIRFIDSLIIDGY